MSLPTWRPDPPPNCSGSCFALVRCAAYLGSTAVVNEDGYLLHDWLPQACELWGTSNSGQRVFGRYGRDLVVQMLNMENLYRYSCSPLSIHQTRKVRVPYHSYLTRSWAQAARELFPISLLQSQNLILPFLPLCMTAMGRLTAWLLTCTIGVTNIPIHMATPSVFRLCVFWWHRRCSC